MHSNESSKSPTAVSSRRSFGAQADGAGSSAVASVKPRGATPLYGVHVASRRWLSFFR